MSKINELIQTLCPDGVEYKKLGEVATNMFRGNGIKRDEVTENGTPCVRYGEIYTTYDIWFDTCVSHTDVDGLKSPKYFGYGAVLIAITGESVLDIAKSTVYVGHEKCLAGGDILVVEHKQNPKYMGYVLSTTDAQDQKSAGKIKSKVVHASAKDLAEIVIPVPPLPVQDEIVRILDEYTALEAELEAKLSEEIELKQKQYEFHMEELLTFGDDVERKKLGDVLDTCTDYTAAGSFADIAKNVQYLSEPDYALLVRTMDIKSKFTKGNLVFVNKHAYEYLWRVHMDSDCIILPNIGANCGEVYYIRVKDLPDIPCVLGPNAILGRSTECNLKYVFYCLNVHDFQRKLAAIISPGGQTKYNKTNLKMLEIPVPSLTEQQRIVKILDKYDTYTRDMISTLNTELESRKKQYAYYRDQLLTFKRKE